MKQLLWNTFSLHLNLLGVSGFYTDNLNIWFMSRTIVSPKYLRFMLVVKTFVSYFLCSEFKKTYLILFLTDSSYCCQIEMKVIVNTTVLVKVISNLALDYILVSRQDTGLPPLLELW